MVSRLLGWGAVVKRPKWWGKQHERAFIAWFWRDAMRAFKARNPNTEVPENFGASTDHIDNMRHAYIAGMRRERRGYVNK